MEHLSAETLARLVDDSATAEEGEHIAACERCARELERYRDQTELLRGLPELMPPKGDWRVLEARLRSEGLLESPGLFQTLGLAQTPPWMRAAAAVVIFLTGLGSGAAFTSRGTAEAAGLEMARPTTIEEAASAVRIAEESYVAAFANLSELLAADGGETLVGDPLSRYAALEQLVSVSQAAVRHAPDDPYLNGVLTSALAERESAARLVSMGGGNWF